MNIPQSFLDSIIDFKLNEINNNDVILKIKLHKTKFNDYFYDRLIHYYYNHFDESDNDTKSEELLDEIYAIDYFTAHIKLNIATFISSMKIEFNGKTLYLLNILEKYYDLRTIFESYFIINGFIINCPHIINLLKLINHSIDIPSINYNQYEINDPEYIKSRHDLLSKSIKNLDLIQKHQYILYNYLLSKEKKIQCNTWNKETYIKFKNLKDRTYILTNNNGCDIDLIMIMLMNDIKISDNILDTNLIICRKNTSREINTKLKKMSKKKYTIIDSKKTLNKYTKSDSDIKNLLTNNIIVIESHLYNSFYSVVNTYYNKNNIENENELSEQTINLGNIVFNKTYVKDVKSGDLSGQFIVHSSKYYYSFSENITNLKDIIEICRYTLNLINLSENISTSNISNIILKTLLDIVKNYYSDLINCNDNLINNPYLLKIFNMRENIGQGKDYLSSKSLFKYSVSDILKNFAKRDEDPKDFYLSKSDNSVLNKIMLLKNNFKKHINNFVYLDENFIYNCLRKNINVTNIKCKPKLNFYESDVDGYFITNNIINDTKMGNINKAFNQLGLNNFKYIRNYLQSLNNIYEDKIIEDDFIPEDLSKEYKNEIDRLKGNECVICMNELKGGKIFLDCCHNVYCFECIVYSLSIKRNCPVCRKKITNKNQLNCLDYNIEDIPEKEAKKKYKTFEQIVSDGKQIHWYKSLEDIITHIRNTNEDHKILINSSKCIQNNKNINKDYILRFQAIHISEVLKRQDIKFEKIGNYSNDEFKSLNAFRNSFDTNCILTTSDFTNYGNNYNYFNNVSDAVLFGENYYTDYSYLLPLLNPYKDNNLNIWILSELEEENDEY